MRIKIHIWSPVARSQLNLEYPITLTVSGSKMSVLVVGAMMTPYDGTPYTAISVEMVGMPASIRQRSTLCLERMLRLCHEGGLAETLLNAMVVSCFTVAVAECPQSLPAAQALSIAFRPSIVAVSQPPVDEELKYGPNGQRGEYPASH